uniref:PPFIA binding protein 1b n=1 Tax=Gasterosteus aculeatus aculeatus TaxID=481459 RepID=A0AAQ4Q0U1_GASAC
MMADASDMLAAALEQMDGIIAGSKTLDYSNGMYDCQSPTSLFMGSLRALHLLEDLRSVLELMDTEERESLRCQIPDSTADRLLEWLHGHLSNGHIYLSGSDHYQERLSQIECDKESLVLQVSVLTDQVEAQGEKIRDLDMCLDEHRDKLNATEEMLQQEILCRTTLETQKLELISEVSNLRLKQNTLEKDRLDFDDRFRDSEDLILEINELRYRLTELKSEKLQYEKKLKSTKSLMAKLSSLRSKMGQMQYEKQRKEHKLQAMKEELAAMRWQLEGKDRETRRLQDETGFRAIASSTLFALCVLRSFIHILPLPVLIITHSVVNCLSSLDVELQRMKKAVESLMAANEEKDRKIDDLKQSLLRYKKVQEMVMSVQGKKGEISLQTAASDDQSSLSLLRCHQFSLHCCVLTISCHDAAQTGSREHLERSNNQKVKANAGAETSEKPPMGPSATSPASTEDESFGSRKARSSFGKGFFKLRGGKKTTSTPNLAEMERQGTDHLDLAGLPQRSANSDSTNTLSMTPESRKKSKGIKKLFGKLKRSQSTTFNLDDNLPEGDFKRGGVRATAGPRLGWSRDLKTANNDVDAPFARWSKDQVCDWLQGQGLGLHVNMARGWISSGQTLLQASQQDLERELGIKHLLHRKKLQLALQALGSEEDDNKGKLDYHWVTRWLDDIGLPQYKTQFDEGRVDGRMLHYMTVDDLLSLKVGSVLHHLSIKRAIQVLRLNNYEPNCLRRRPSDENNISPAEISQWTNHRVMEWLRSADLAEYAPNLRGSGVHGGLMVLEPRFNVETMALLLNIPPNKTLLRRHLGTHFNLLIGLEAQQLKQECLENTDYTLLTATTKVKPRKLSFGNFGSLRRKKQDETEEYVCPMDVEMPKGRSFQKGFELQIYEDDLDRLEQMEDSEGTVRQIGAFSEGIQNLTSMLKDDEFFKEASNSPNPSVTDEDSNA